MKSKSLLISVVLLFVTINLIAQGTDQDGNSLSTTQIGSQVWTIKNLNVTHFRNGDIIPEIEDTTAWKQASIDGKPAWCYYWSDNSEGQIYGKLYNWYAVNDPRGLAPAGWHIPSDKEWTDLTTYLGGEDIAGKKMKDTGSGYGGFNYNGTNESGFKGYLAGMRDYKGTFGFLGQVGCWWSSSEYDTENGWYRMLSYDESNIARDYGSKRCGASIRCVKDL
jgi:uncharacterized protein (TIGR02145 family)